MGERVSQGVAQMSSAEQLLRGRLISVALVDALQLNRLVQVIGRTPGYWYPTIFCT